MQNKYVPIKESETKCRRCFSLNSYNVQNYAPNVYTCCKQLIALPDVRITIHSCAQELPISWAFQLVGNVEFFMIIIDLFYLCVLVILKCNYKKVELKYIVKSKLFN